MTTLKPCRCGGDGLPVPTVRYLAIGVHVRIQCSTCGDYECAIGGHDEYKATRDEAISKWNARNSTEGKDA